MGSIADVPEVSYLAIIESLAFLEPPVFIFGGIAEDALLDGSITRPQVEPGIASFVLPVDPGLVRISLPDDALRHPIGSIDGAPIRTVSPLALYQLREAFIHTGVFGPPRAKDRAAQARLRQELLIDIQETDLSPRIRKE